MVTNLVYDHVIGGREGVKYFASPKNVTTPPNCIFDVKKIESVKFGYYLRGGGGGPENLNFWGSPPPLQT